MLNEQLSYSVDHQQYLISINSSNKVIEAGVIQKDDITGIYSITLSTGEAATVIVLYKILTSGQNLFADIVDLLQAN